MTALWWDRHNGSKMGSLILSCGERSAQTREGGVRRKAEIRCGCVLLSILSGNSSPCRAPHYKYLFCSDSPEHSGDHYLAAFSRPWPHTLDLPQTVFLNLYGKSQHWQLCRFYIKIHIFLYLIKKKRTIEPFWCSLTAAISYGCGLSRAFFRRGCALKLATVSALRLGTG